MSALLYEFEGALSWSKRWMIKYWLKQRAFYDPLLVLNEEQVQV
jgi:hypothetical protein